MQSVADFYRGLFSFSSRIGSVNGIHQGIAVEFNRLSGDIMSIKAIEEDRLKSLLKTALLEALDERRDLFRELIAEAIEDLAMARAIEEGAASRIVDSSEVYKILDDKE